MILESGACAGLLVNGSRQVATHFAYPASGRTRYFLPLEKRAARASKTFFLSGLKRLKFDAAHALGCLYVPSRKMGLCESGLVEELKVAVGCKTATIAVVVGTPGPNAKSTVLLLDERCKPIAICKIAATESATKLLENEWYWLNILSRLPSLHASMPIPMTIRISGDVFMMVQSVNTDSLAEHVLDWKKIDFLGALHKATGLEEHFTGSVMHQNILTRLLKLQGMMAPPWTKRTEKTLMLLESGFRRTDVRMVVAHRDFVPWNMRVAPTRVFVFDWEYASNGYLPMYDLFHFLLMPAALKGDISRRTMRRILTKAVCAAQGLPPGAGVLPNCQLLAYLLDLSLLYLEANSGRDSGDRVLALYARLIDEFEMWRAE